MPSKITDLNPDALLAEHCSGDSLRVVAARHHVSHEFVRTVVIERGGELIRRIESELAELGWTSCMVPFGATQHLPSGLAMFFWVVRTLRSRGHLVRVVTRPSKLGALFVIENENEEER
jgi:hypothetical protein